MKKPQSRGKSRHFEDVIPAFLAPDHIVNQEKKKTATPTNIIDIVEDTYQKQNENSVSDLIIRERLHDAMEQKHIDLFMQPIVTLPQRHVQFYEFFGRLRVKPGFYIPAQEYLNLANEEHIISQLDTILLSQCLKILQKQKHRLKEQLSYFINIKPFTLRNHHFINNLLNLLSRHQYIGHSLIFEMHYNEFLLLSPAEKKILHELARLGCRFSIDHLEHIPIDVKYLRARHIHFIKIKAETILREGESERGFSEILTKKHNLDVNKIDLIVEKTENEDDLKEILDYDIKYGQGFLFGRPDFQGVYTTYRF